MAKTNMTSKEIYNQLWKIFQNYDYKLRNSFIYDWESDFFAISSSGYTIEVEVKMSKSDFKADYKKITSRGVNKHDYLSSNNTIKPNKFYFACPEVLIHPDEINPNYGLIWIIDDYHWYIKRKAEFLHKNKQLDELWMCKSLMNKFYHRNLELFRLNELRQSSIKFGENKLNIFDYY